MNRKIMIAVGIVVLSILVVLAAYSSDNPNTTNENRTTLNVSSEGPVKLSKITEDIKTHSYYNGYDNETLRWMESLGDKYVFVSLDEFVIMDKWDADKIPSVYACDAYFDELFSCNVLENHSLGDIKYPKDVVLVKNVEYIGEEIHYAEV